MDVPASLLMSSGVHAYVAVKASLHASHSSVFGLSNVETSALVKRFHNYREDIVNGVLLNGSPIEVVNALSELGYRIIGTSGEAEVVWTMQRDI